MRRALFALTLLMAGCAHAGGSAPEPPTETPSPAPTVAVSATRARRGAIESSATAVGTLWPRTQASVSSKLSAAIVQMGLLRNHRVEAGQVLAVQETRDLRAQRDEAAAAVNEARLTARGQAQGAIPLADEQSARDLADARSTDAAARALYQRRVNLYRQGGLALRDLEASQLAYSTARHGLKLTRDTVRLRQSAINPGDRALAEARIRSASEHIATLDTQIAYGTILAPITGTVVEQAAFQGDMLTSGAKLVTIADLSVLILKAPFPDEQAAMMHVGDPVTVEPSDRPGKKIAARISAISPVSDPTSRAVEVWVPLLNPDGRLRAGGAATVVAPLRRHGAAVLVPRSAITFDPATNRSGKVMVVDKEGVAHERAVQCGLSNASEVEVTAGLKPGETVVRVGNFALPDGAHVVTR